METHSHKTGYLFFTRHGERADDKKVRTSVLGLKHYISSFCLLDSLTERLYLQF